MSDLWNRCLARLRSEMDTARWDREVAPLRTWMDAGTLHVWTAPDVPRPHRGLSRELEQRIRAAARAVWGRAPRRIVYWRRPPNRERITNERRSVEYRAQVHRRQNAELDAFGACWHEVVGWLKRTPEALPRLHGSPAAQRAQMQTFVADRTKEWLAQGWSTKGLRASRGSPAPPSAPATRTRPPPESTAPAATRNTTRANGEPPRRLDDDRELAGLADLDAARRRMPWLAEE